MKLILFIFIGVMLLTVGCQNNHSKQDNKNTTTNTNTVKKTMSVQDSLNFLTRQLQTDYNNTENWYKRAQFLIRQGDLKNALLDMQEVINRDTTTAKYRLTYADLLVAKLDIEQAVKHYDYVLTVDSLSALAYVGLGRIYAYLDNPGKATALLNKAQKINPHLAESYYLEGMIYKDDYYKTKREESWKRALSSFQTVVEQNPKHYNAYISLGVMHFERGEDLALDYFNSAINVAPKSTEAWYNKAFFYQSKKDFNKAKELYRKIIFSVDSLYSKAYYNQGYLQLVIDKNNDSAVYFFEKTIKIDSLYVEAYNNLGLAYERKGDKTLAKKYYKKALKINPDFELAKKNLNYVNRH